MTSKIRFAPLCALLFGCSPVVTSSSYAPPLPEIPGVRLELLYAVEVPADGVGREARAEGAIVGGLDGALDPAVEMIVRDDALFEMARGRPDERGRVRLVVRARAGDMLHLEFAGIGVDPIAFRVRDASVARGDAVRPSLSGAGSIPNDLLVLGDSEHPKGLIVRSGDNAVSVFDVSEGLSDRSAGVRLPAADGRFGPRPANPWFAASLDPSGTRIAVTAYGQQRVFIVDLVKREIERTLEIEDNVVLDSPFGLARAVDVDGDGAVEMKVSRFVPRTPQAIVVSDDALVVAFTNYLSPRLDRDRPPVFLPGVIAVWSLSDLDLPPRTLTLGAINPQELRRSADGSILAVCSGVIDHLAGEVQSRSKGAVFRLDPFGLQILDEFDLGDFAPSTGVVIARALWVGSVLKGALRRIDLEDRSIPPLDMSLNDESVDSIFRLVELPGGLLGAPSFNTDRLHVLDPVERRLAPAPFFGPLVVGPGRPIFDGLQIVARRPGRAGVDFVGPDLYALAGIASRITPIELRQVLGP